MHDEQASSLPALYALGVRVFAEQAREGHERQDVIAAETPVALVFNGISHAVMMATPQDLEDFALGFALSEGVLDAVEDCSDIEVVCGNACSAERPACEVRLQISSRCFMRLKERRRSLVGRTGCGVCGTDSLNALELKIERPMVSYPWIGEVDLPQILRALAALPGLQPLNAQTGSLHAAAWALPEGGIYAAHEDVGRHNALDKLFGQLAREKLLGTPGFVILTSRASYELVRKSARMGVGLVATISAPTELAVNLARQANMQLWGLCRAPRGVRYC